MSVHNEHGHVHTARRPGGTDVACWTLPGPALPASPSFAVRGWLSARAASLALYSHRPLSLPELFPEPWKRSLKVSPAESLTSSWRKQ